MPAWSSSEILVALNEQVNALEGGVEPAGPEPLARARAEGDRDERVVERPRRSRCAGMTAGIDEQGALLVRTGPDIQRVISGEVCWD